MGAHAHLEQVIRRLSQRHQVRRALLELRVGARCDHLVVRRQRLGARRAVHAQLRRCGLDGVALGEHALLKAHSNLLLELIGQAVDHCLVVHGEELLIIEVCHLIIDVVRLAAFIHETLALRVDPQRLGADQLGLARLDRTRQNAVRAAVTRVSRTDVQPHLQPGTVKADTHFRVNANVIRAILRNHLGIAAETARRDDDGLSVVDDLLARLFGAHAHDAARRLVHDERGCIGIEMEVHALLLGQLSYGLQRIVGVVLAHVPALDLVLAVALDLVLERDLQILAQPVDRLAGVIGHEAVHSQVDLVGVAREQIVVVVIRRVVDTELLLLHRARAVERSERKRAGTALPAELLDAHRLRAVFSGEGGRRGSRTARTDDHHIVDILRSALRAAGQIAKRDGCQPQARKADELAAAQAATCVKRHIVRSHSAPPSSASRSCSRCTTSSHRAPRPRHGTACSTSRTRNAPYGIRRSRYRHAAAHAG